MCANQQFPSRSSLPPLSQTLPPIHTSFSSQFPCFGNLVWSSWRRLRRLSYSVLASLFSSVPLSRAFSSWWWVLSHRISTCFLTISLTYSFLYRTQKTAHNSPTNGAPERHSLPSLLLIFQWSSTWSECGFRRFSAAGFSRLRRHLNPLWMAFGVAATTPIVKVEALRTLILPPSAWPLLRVRSGWWTMSGCRTWRRLLHLHLATRPRVPSSSQTRSILLMRLGAVNTAKIRHKRPMGRGNAGATDEVAKVNRLHVSRNITTTIPWCIWFDVVDTSDLRQALT